MPPRCMAKPVRAAAAKDKESSCGVAEASKVEEDRSCQDHENKGKVGLVSDPRRLSAVPRARAKQANTVLVFSKSMSGTDPAPSAAKAKKRKPAAFQATRSPLPRNTSLLSFRSPLRMTGTPIAPTFVVLTSGQPNMNTAPTPIITPPETARPVFRSSRDFEVQLFGQQCRDQASKRMPSIVPAGSAPGRDWGYCLKKLIAAARSGVPLRGSGGARYNNSGRC